MTAKSFKLLFFSLPLEGEGPGMGWRHPVKGRLRHAEQGHRVNAINWHQRASTPSQPFPLQGKGFGWLQQHATILADGAFTKARA